MRLSGIFALFLAVAGRAQEAGSGFDLRMTLSDASFYSHQLDQSPRDGEPFSDGFRAMLYPTWKLNSHWVLAGALQIHSRPYFGEEFRTQGYGVKGDLVQLSLGYNIFWRNHSLAVRAGELSSAFGAFPTRYDSADNPLIGMPYGYGYYSGVSLLSLAGVQADATLGKLDLRAQFVNSSPANRRSLFDTDQHGNWGGGLGYTIRQGFRAGASAYYGPYLNRRYEYYFPGEAPPHDLPAAAYGLDVQWGRGSWNAWGELQHVRMEYLKIPSFTMQAGYAELRKVLNPHWYAAVRTGYLRTSASPGSESYEATIGYRLSGRQLLKFGYQIQQGERYRGTLGNTAAIEFVTAFRAFSWSKD